MNIFLDNSVKVLIKKAIPGSRMAFFVCYGASVTEPVEVTYLSESVLRHFDRLSDRQAQ